MTDRNPAMTVIAWTPGDAVANPTRGRVRLFGCGEIVPPEWTRTAGAASSAVRHYSGVHRQGLPPLTKRAERLVHLGRRDAIAENHPEGLAHQVVAHQDVPATVGRRILTLAGRPRKPAQMPPPGPEAA